MNGKLVLFDIDGTILLTAGAGRRAIVAALRTRSPTPPCSRASASTARPIRRSSPRCWRSRGSGAARPDRVRALCQRYVGCSRARAAHDATTIMPGVNPLLDRLEQRTGRRARPPHRQSREGAALKLRSGGLDPARFRVGAYGSDAGHRPDLPRSPPAARGVFGRVPTGAEVVIIGDTPADIACGAGIAPARSPSPPAPTRWGTSPAARTPYSRT